MVRGENQQFMVGMGMGISMGISMDMG